MRSSRAGFTLIELLVVIAIIAILASILFPVFARARAKARQSACSSNMKQLGLALIAYASDYDNMIPYWDTNEYQTPKTGHNTWDVTLLPYVKNTQIMACPDNKFNHESVTVPGGGGTQNGPKRGYALPRYVSGKDQDAPPSPVNTVLLIEKGAYAVGTTCDAAAEYCQQAGESADYPSVPYRHNNGLNFVYVDGHCKWSAGSAGPFANDGLGKAACDAERTAAGCADDEWYGHNKKGHICWEADWPQE